LDRRKLPGDGRIRQCALQRRRRAARKLSGWGPDGADRDPTRDLIQEAAGVESIDDLRMAIQRSDGMRTLQTEFDRLANALAQDGDGLSIAALSAECEATDLDEIALMRLTAHLPTDWAEQRALLGFC